MLDFTGKQLQVGDNVAMIIPAFKELSKGRIVIITSNDRATVEYQYNDKIKKVSRESRQLLKI